MKLLLIDDQKDFSRVLQKGLEEEDFEVKTCLNGQEALQSLKEYSADLIIVDSMMPIMDGHTFIEERRKSDQEIPILMLTAKDDLESKLSSFAKGADDYLTKPFSFEELLYRIKSLLKRSSFKERGPSIQYGNIKLDLSSHKVFEKNKSIDLTKTEFDILALLLAEQDKVIERKIILEKVRGYHFDTNTNIVDVHIRSIRKKFQSSFIKTVRGIGYMIEKL